MLVEILNPDKTLFSGETTSVVLPGVNGGFQILNNHAPMIANLSVGNVVVGEGKDAQTFEIKSGLVEVLKNKVIILV